MSLDALLKVSAAQQVTADAVTANTVDFGNTTPKRKVAVGEALALLVVITAIGTNSGSAKLQAIQSAAADLSSPQIIGEIDLATADIAAGKIYIIPLSAGTPALRYAGGNFDITGTVDFTVDAYLVPRALVSILAESYPSGYTIS
jgi:hypothetical protein